LATRDDGSTGGTRASQHRLSVPSLQLSKPEDSAELISEMVSSRKELQSQLADAITAIKDLVSVLLLS
jgi:hypothetical protein